MFMRGVIVGGCWMCYLKEPPLTQICSLGCYEVSESVWVGVGEVCDIWALKRVCARCFT